VTPNRKTFLAVGAGAIALLLVLGYFNIKRSLSEKTLRSAVDQIVQINERLGKSPIDWDAIEAIYTGSLKKLVRDTRRFATNSYLQGKIVESIEAGKAGQLEPVAAVLLERTWLRIGLYHVSEMLNPTQEQEAGLSTEERSARISIFLPVVMATMADDATPNAAWRQSQLEAALESWRQNPGAETAEQFQDVLAGALVEMILSKLDQWQALGEKNRENQGELLTLQADMRQLIYPIYAEFYDTLGQEAWEVFTEFTRRPEEVHPELIRTKILQEFADELAVYEGGRIPKTQGAVVKPPTAP
jgi:hypothetical protein